MGCNPTEIMRTKARRGGDKLAPGILQELTNASFHTSTVHASKLKRELSWWRRGTSQSRQVHLARNGKHAFKLRTESETRRTTDGCQVVKHGTRSVLVGTQLFILLHHPGDPFGEALPDP